MTVLLKSNVPSLWPWPLPYESHFFISVLYFFISVLYEFQIDISTNSWAIKYQNMGIGLLNVAHVKNDVKWHTDREYE